MPMLLHVGCGSARKADTTPGFAGPAWTELRLDIDPSVQPDVVGSMTDMGAVADASADAVFSSHNLEHLYSFEVPAALQEFRRVLKADGFAVVTCPDLQSVAALVAEDKLLEAAYQSPQGSISAIDMIYGHRAAMARGALHMAHRCGFTRRVLGAVLLQAGFANVVVVRRPEHFDLWALATQDRRRRSDLQALAQAHFPVTLA